MVDFLEYFYNSDADTYFVRDESGKVVNEITRDMVIESLQAKRPINFDKKVEKPTNFKMFLTDCDGCLTDGGMYYSENGDELKKFNTKDGMGFSFLRKRGIVVGIVTGETRELNRRRAEKLKLDVLESGCGNKLETIKNLCEKYGCTMDEVVYVGDDMNDIEVIKNVGFGCCPANANYKVREVAKFVTRAKGGEGVIREVIDYLLA